MDLLTHYPALQTLGVVYLILVLKMVAVGSYTSVFRIRRGHYATPEDFALQGLTPPAAPDEDIERARRAHRNDLENILPFFGAAVFYALTQPSLAMARIYFWGFGIARILHTVFYLRRMQPHRTIAFTVGLLLMLAMVLRTLVALL
ncbi:MAG TPA: MAPEG family protein [Candidatus Kryptonia bacterium]|nr:MAPEG family protein [Candidatus Kryptonia bacterium]